MAKRGGTLMRSWVALVAIAACRGRGPVPPPAASPQPSPAELSASLDGSLDRLEERLLADQATVRFWREMQARHESVTAIATVNAEGHAGRGRAVEERPRERRESAKRTRVAARAVPSGQGGP